MKVFSSITREQLLRMMLILTLLIFAYYWICGILPHQLAYAPIYNISIDNSFWLFHLTGIPDWIISHPGGLIMFEILFIILGAMLAHSGNYGWAIAFLIIGLPLSFLQQTYSCTLTKVSVLFLVLYLPFCFPRKLFPFVWKLPRYYLVYLMVTAGLYKFTNGGIYELDNMQNILLNQHIDLNVYGFNHISHFISEFLLTNKLLRYLAYLIIELIELCFIVLLFTRKFDKYFLWTIILFVIAIYITMRIYSFEILYLIFPLIPIANVDE